MGRRPRSVRGQRLSGTETRRGGTSLHRGEPHVGPAPAGRLDEGSIHSGFFVDVRSERGGPERRHTESVGAVERHRLDVRHDRHRTSVVAAQSTEFKA